MLDNGFTVCRDKKYDIQLSQALIRERRLGEIFKTAAIEFIELKSENHQWEKTGNICIEYECKGYPSGIAATQADFWVHELLRGDQTLVYLMFPVARLKELARAAWDEGRRHENSGDGGNTKVVLVRLRDILK